MKMRLQRGAYYECYIVEFTMNINLIMQKKWDVENEDILTRAWMKYYKMKNEGFSSRYHKNALFPNNP